MSASEQGGFCLEQDLSGSERFGNWSNICHVYWNIAIKVSGFVASINPAIAENESVLSGAKGLLTSDSDRFYWVRTSPSSRHQHLNTCGEKKERLLKFGLVRI